MSFLKKIFEGESKVSSRRVIAIWFSFVLIPYIIYKTDYCNLLGIFEYCIYFLIVLLGFTTSQNISKYFKKSSQPNPDHEEH